MQLFSYQTMSLVRDYCVKCKLTRDYCVNVNSWKNVKQETPHFIYSLLLIIDFYIIHVTKNDL